MIVSFAANAMNGNYTVAAICYVVKFALDEVDGNSARYLGQSKLSITKCLRNKTKTTTRQQRIAFEHKRLTIIVIFLYPLSRRQTLLLTNVSFM